MACLLHKNAASVEVCTDTMSTVRVGFKMKAVQSPFLACLSPVYLRSSWRVTAFLEFNTKYFGYRALKLYIEGCFCCEAGSLLLKRRRE